MTASAAPRWSLVVGLAVLLLWPAFAVREDYARVLSQEAQGVAGPGRTFGGLDRAERGDGVRVLGGSGGGFWFRVELEEGRSGWVLGDVLHPFEVVEDHEPGGFTRLGRAIRRAALGPPPVPDA